MDLAEALLHRYTTSVVAILNAVRPTLARHHPHAAPKSSLSAPRSRTTRRTRPPEPTPAPADTRPLDRSQQSSGESGAESSRSLGALRDLLPALSALAPTGGPQLINTLTRWYQQQARALASSSGDRNPLGRSRTLQLAFWHAAHRVLAPLPPGALAGTDVARVIDLAFDAVIAGRDPAPHVDAGWGVRPLAGGADGYLAPQDDESGGIHGSHASPGGARVAHIGGGDVALAAASPPLDPSPSVASMASRVLGLASRHDPDAVTARLVEELEPRVNSESKRGEVHLIVHGARFLHVSLDGGAGPTSTAASKGSVGGRVCHVDANNPSKSASSAGELADRYAASAAQTVRRLNPCAWHPTYRKSDLRHALCALLHCVLAPVAGARIPEAASDVTRRDWAEAVTTCREDVDKWLRSKEKKHAAAG